MALAEGPVVDYADSDMDSVDSENDEEHDHGGDLLRDATVAALRQKYNGGDRAESFRGCGRDIPTPLLADGRPLSVHISQAYLAIEETGGAVYDASLVLVDYLLGDERLARLSGKPAFAIELGAGPGYVSVTLALADARVIATDGDPAVVELGGRSCRDNGVLAGEAGSRPGWVKPMVLRWGDAGDVAKVVAAAREELKGAEARPLVLLSDLLYPGADVDALEATVRALAEELDPVFCLSHSKRKRAQEMCFLRRLSVDFEMRRELRWAPRSDSSMHSFYLHCFWRKEVVASAMAGA